MPRYLKILIWIIIFGGLYYRYFFYLDLANGCHISILPSLELSNLNIKEALAVLKRVTPDDYRDVCQYVTRVNPNFSCGGIGGGCAFRNIPKSIDISTSMDDLAWSAAIIVHETCHAKQFQQGRSVSEDECYLEDDRVIKKLMEY